MRNLILRKRIAVAVSMVCLLPVVNAKTAKQRNSTLREFVQNILKTGDDNNIGANIARDLDIDIANKTKANQRLAQNCVDGRYRTFDVVIDNNSSISDLVLLTKKEAADASESHWFRLKPDGTLVKAFRLTGKYDENHKPIRGSGIKIDLEAAEAKKLLKRELDFWLKGVGQRKAKTPNAGK